MRCLLMLGLLALSIFAPLGYASLLVNEATFGDLSNDRLNPSRFVLGLGSNVLMASSVGEDREYFTLAVQGGTALSAVVLTAYASSDFDEVAFIAVQQGSTLTVAPLVARPEDLLGYAHFGTRTGPIPFDYLAGMLSSNGVTGFERGLPAGEYTFWIQQLYSVQPTAYSFDFVTSAVVVPEMGTGLGVVVAGGFMGGVMGLRRWRVGG